MQLNTFNDSQIPSAAQRVCCQNNFHPNDFCHFSYSRMSASKRLNLKLKQLGLCQNRILAFNETGSPAARKQHHTQFKRTASCFAVVARASDLKLALMYVGTSTKKQQQGNYCFSITITYFIPLIKNLYALIEQ